MKKIDITEKFGLKVMALFFAVILWVVVVNVDDPVTSKVFKNIPVTVVNEEVVTNTGKTYKIEDETQTVSVSVSAKRSEISRIEEEDLVVTADLKEMETSTLLVPLTASVEGNIEYQSVETTPKNFHVTIEDVTKKTFPISVNVSGTPRDGYSVGNLVSNPEKITIRGSESQVNSIDKAVARVNVSGMSESQELVAELLLYDENGTVIDQSQLTNNLGDQGLTVQVQILSSKAVPIHIQVSGTPAEGYVYAGYECEPETVRICANQEVLDGIEEIWVSDDQLNITGADSKREVTIDILPYLPEGVSLENEAEKNIAVTVKVEQSGSKTVELPVEAIKVNNLSENLEVSFASETELELQFTGAADVLETLDSKNGAYIDLKEYTTPGEYEVPVHVDVSTAVTLVGEPTVKVVLREKSKD